MTVFSRLRHASAAGAAPIDVVRLRERLGRNQAQLPRLVQMFLEDSVRWTDACARAIAAGVLADGIQAVQALEISSAALAADDLAVAARELQHHLAASNLQGASVALQTVDRQIARLRPHLLQIIRDAGDVLLADEASA